MKKKNHLTGCLLLLFLSLIVNTTLGQNPDDFDQEADNVKRILQHFSEYDMPVQMANDKNAKFTAYHVKENMRQYPWLTDQMITDTAKCNMNIYLIEVTTKGRIMKYLYCIQKSQVNLISRYELKNNKWIKIKQRDYRDYSTGTIVSGLDT
jgi:hypothetical protein